MSFYFDQKQMFRKNNLLKLLDLSFWLFAYNDYFFVLGFFLFVCFSQTIISSSLIRKDTTIENKSEDI